MIKNERQFPNPRNSIIFDHFSRFSNAPNFAPNWPVFPILISNYSFFLLLSSLFYEIFVVIFKSLPLVNHQWLLFVHFSHVKFPRKMDFVLKRCHQVGFDWTRAFSYMLWPIKWEQPCGEGVPSKEFLTFWDGDSATFLRIPHITAPCRRRIRLGTNNCN